MPIRSIPAGVIFISSPRVNLISTKRVTFSRRQGSICTDFSTHRALAFFGDTFEHLHIELPLVVDDRNTCAVNKTDSGTLSETGQLEEHRQCHEATRHDLDKTVIRESPGEQMLPLSTYA